MGKDESASFVCSVSSSVCFFFFLFFWQLPFSMLIFFPHFQSVFESEEAYYKHIGYQEDEGKIESVEDYLKRLEAYMKLYGALVQVCLCPSYGIKEFKLPPMVMLVEYCCLNFSSCPLIH